MALVHRVDPDRYRAATLVGRATELESLRLAEVHSFSATGQNSAIENDSLIFDVNGEYSFIEKENKLIVRINCGLNPPKPKRTNKKNQGFGIQAVYELAYRFTKVGPPPPELRNLFFESFANIGAVYVLWPFWRELVFSFTQRFGIDPIILPTIQFQPDAEKKAIPKKTLKQTSAKNKQIATASSEAKNKKQTK
jgi:hypothetical protein